MVWSKDPSVSSLAIAPCGLPGVTGGVGKCGHLVQFSVAGCGAVVGCSGQLPHNGRDEPTKSRVALTRSSRYTYTHEHGTYRLEVPLLDAGVVFPTGPHTFCSAPQGSLALEQELGSLLPPKVTKSQNPPAGATARDEKRIIALILLQRNSIGRREQAASNFATCSKVERLWTTRDSSTPPHSAPLQITTRTKYSVLDETKHDITKHRQHIRQLAIAPCELESYLAHTCSECLKWPFLLQYNWAKSGIEAAKLGR